MTLINIDPTDPIAAPTDEEFVVRCYLGLLGYKSPADIDEEGFKNWMGKLKHEAANGVPPAKTRAEIAGFFRNQAMAINAVELLRCEPEMKKVAQETKEGTPQAKFEAMVL